MKKMLTIGSMVCSIAPISAAVSCGANEQNNESKNNAMTTKHQEHYDVDFLRLHKTMMFNNHSAHFLTWHSKRPRPGYDYDISVRLGEGPETIVINTAQLTGDFRIQRPRDFDGTYRPFNTDFIHRGFETFNFKNELYSNVEADSNNDKSLNKAAIKSIDTSFAEKTISVMWEGDITGIFHRAFLTGAGEREIIFHHYACQTNKKVVIKREMKLYTITMNDGSVIKAYTDDEYQLLFDEIHSKLGTPPSEWGMDLTLLKYEHAVGAPAIKPALSDSHNWVFEDSSVSTELLPNRQSDMYILDKNSLDAILGD